MGFHRGSALKIVGQFQLVTGFLGVGTLPFVDVLAGEHRDPVVSNS